MIDNEQHAAHGLGSTYFLNEDKKTLVESGPAVSARPIINGLECLGIKPEDIAYVIVTHIHLDHAGGAGVLAKAMPRAKVLVHSRGAPHLIDPSRLVNSVREVQGEAILAKYGEVVPIAKEQVQSVAGGDVIRLSDKQELRVIDAPGHAPHEVCIYESRNRGLFPGDAVALSLAEGRVFLPYHPPPNFDMELNTQTIKKLKDLKAEILYYSHFGISRRVREDMRLALDKIQDWHDMIVKSIKNGTFDSVGEKLLAQVEGELAPIKGNKPLYDFIANNHLPMVIEGHMGYYREHFNDFIARS